MGRISQGRVQEFRHRLSAFAMAALLLGAAGLSYAAEPASVLASAGGSAVALNFQPQPSASYASGATITVGVQAVDSNGQKVSSWSGTVTLSVTNNAAPLLGTTTLNVSGGKNQFHVSIDCAGSYSLTATDDANSGPLSTGTSSQFVITGRACVSGEQSTISASPTSITFGGTSAITVQAKDASGNNLTTSAGTVTLSTTLGTVTAATDNGNGTYSATFSGTSVGTATISGTIGGQTIGTNAIVTVGQAAASCSVTGYNVTYDANAHTASGSCIGVGGSTVGTLDLSGTTHTNVGTYTDSWSFSDSSGNYASQSGSVTDAITPGQATYFSVTAPADVTAGTAFHVTVTAKDQYGNTATGYSGTVHFTSTDTGSRVSLPADSTLTNGTGTFSATLVTIGNQTITATDTSSSSITGGATTFVASAVCTSWTNCNGNATSPDQDLFGNLFSPGGSAPTVYLTLGLNSTTGDAGIYNADCGVPTGAQLVGQEGNLQVFGNAPTDMQTTQVMIFHKAYLQSIGYASRNAAQFNVCLGAIYLPNPSATASGNLTYAGAAYSGTWYGKEASGNQQPAQFATDYTGTGRWWATAADCSATFIRPGYDPCVGLKTKNGSQLRSYLTSLNFSDVTNVMKFMGSGDLAIVVVKSYPWDSRGAYY